MADRRRVAVLGGGPAGLAAAWELSDPDLLEPLDVTVYQLGWRLGGKCANGRQDRYSQRILEHGPHLFFGWYQQTFDLMKACYDEIRGTEGVRFQNWTDAFKPEDSFVLMEEWKGRWYPRSHTIPRLGGEPYEPSDWSLADALKTSARWVGRAGAVRAEQLDKVLPPDPQPPGWAEAMGAHRTTTERGAWQVQIPGLLEKVATPSEGTEEVHALVAAAERTTMLAGELRARLLGLKDLERDLEWFKRSLDFWWAIVRGLLDDGVLAGENDFEDLDGEELTAWLQRHGCEGDHRTVPFLRGIYDLAFAWEDGEHVTPNGAAGVALRNLLPTLFGHRGGFMWKMQAGTGDTVVTPLYQALRKRGVKFQFFHWVLNLGVDEITNCIDHIEVVEQVSRRPDEEYDPLVDVGELKCWPAEPRWQYLRASPKVQAVDLELIPNPEKRKPKVLERGGDDIEEGFEYVVLALPVSILDSVCPELCRADESFREMVARSVTVATRALQLWLGRKPEELGNPGPGRVTAAHEALFDSCLDAPHLTEREQWLGAERPNDIAQFCSVMPGGPDTDQQHADDAVKCAALVFVSQQLSRVWPHFSTDDLVDPDYGSGLQRLDRQYWRANVAATQRYAQSPAGSIEFRLSPEWDGFPNLVLAGDWTRMGVDAGCVEAAVRSGRRAGKELARRAGVVPDQRTA